MSIILYIACIAISVILVTLVSVQKTPEGPGKAKLVCGKDKVIQKATIIMAVVLAALLVVLIFV